MKKDFIFAPALLLIAIGLGLLKVTGIVNNTHLCGETTAEEIIKGAKLAHALSEATGLPVVHHAVQEKFVEAVKPSLTEPILPMKIYMKKPWEIIFCEEE